MRRRVIRTLNRTGSPDDERERRGEDLPVHLALEERRQVPATGTSTPTVSLPGLVELPVTFVAPSTLVQPLAPAAQTCVWK